MIKNKVNKNVTKSPQEMMMLINKQREEILALQEQLLNKGISPQVSGGKSGRTIIEENQQLKSQLSELQNEFDHYKENKNSQIEELTDRLEKMESLEAKLREFEKHDNVLSMIEKFEN